MRIEKAVLVLMLSVANLSHEPSLAAGESVACVPAGVVRNELRVGSDRTTLVEFSTRSVRSAESGSAKAMWDLFLPSLSTAPIPVRRRGPVSDPFGIRAVGREFRILDPVTPGRGGCQIPIPDWTWEESKRPEVIDGVRADDYRIVVLALAANADRSSGDAVIALTLPRASGRPAMFDIGNRRIDRGSLDGLLDDRRLSAEARARPAGMYSARVELGETASTAEVAWLP